MAAAVAMGARVWDSARIVWSAPVMVRFRGGVLAVLGLLLVIAMGSWSPADPSWNAAAAGEPGNWLGHGGAVAADLALQSVGLAAWPAALLLVAFGLAQTLGPAMEGRLRPGPLRAWAAVAGVLALSAALSAP